MLLRSKERQHQQLGQEDLEDDGRPRSYSSSSSAATTSANRRLILLVLILPALFCVLLLFIAAFSLLNQPTAGSHQHLLQSTTVFSTHRHDDDDDDGMDTANRTHRRRHHLPPLAKQIPRLSRAEKRRLVQEQYKRDGLELPVEFFMADWGENIDNSGEEEEENEDGEQSGDLGRRPRRKKNRRHTSDAKNHQNQQRPHRLRWHRRRNNNSNGGKGNYYVIGRNYRPRMSQLLIANNTAPCPEKLDAVTQAFNKRLYLFAGSLVYEVWRDWQGLQQRQAYPLGELFPGGPRRVTAALTNLKSGVTLLLEYRHTYRFRWNKRHKRFYLARNCPRPLPTEVDFVPRLGFQWREGHLILANDQKFISYDPFWNLATFTSDKLTDYFPNLAIRRMVGVVGQGREEMLWLTADAQLQAYEHGRRQHYRLGPEYPLNLGRMLACLDTNITNESRTRSTPTITPRTNRYD